MGGSGPSLDACAREIFAEWAACHHFHMYDDVAPVLQELAAKGFKIGLISNSHRSLTSFEQHFQLDGLISAAVSSSQHGYLKPHPSIFDAALKLATVPGVGAASAARPSSATRTNRAASSASGSTASR